ncbi:hypothetical protein Tco_1062312, partial [Tanacetum coccineum]
AYKNDNLMSLKPHRITTISFKPTLENEVPLTTHMCKVPELSLEPIKYLISPSKEMNVDDSADKSLSRTSVQLVQEQLVEKERQKAAQEIHSPFDTELEIKVIKRYQSPLLDDEDHITLLGTVFDDMDQREEEPADSDLHSMPDDEVQSISGFDSSNSNDEATADKTLDEEQLLKAVWAKVGKSVNKTVWKEMDIVKDKIFYCGDAANVFKEAKAEGEKVSLEEGMALELSEEAKVKAAEEAKAKAAEEAKENIQGEPHPINTTNSKDDKTEAQGELSSVQAPPTTEPIPSVLPQNISLKQFTDSLFQTTSSKYSLTLLRDENKGKGIAVEEEPLKQLLPLIGQGGSDPKMLNLYQFGVSGKKMTLEDAQAQLNELKRLANLIALIAFDLPAFEKKRKCASELLEEVFMKEDIRVDGMQRNLIPPPGVEGSKGLVIREPEPEIFYNGNFDLVFQREEEFHLATTAQLASTGIEGLAECKASTRNLRRIQVKDIVKEVKDYLKTYSSARMDIKWYVEGIHCASKEI